MMLVLYLVRITGQPMQVCIIPKTVYSLINLIKNIHTDLNSCGIFTNKCSLGCSVFPVYAYLRKIISVVLGVFLARFGLF